MVSLLEDRRRILLNTPHVEEVSDGIANFKTDVPANLKKCLVNIDPIQDLHGYDRPWSPGGGKNLFPLTVEGIKAVNPSATWQGNSAVVNGVTFSIQTDNDGNVMGILANGTATEDWTKLFLFSTYNLPAGSYIFDGLTGGDWSTYRITYGANETNISIVNGPRTDTFDNATIINNGQIIIRFTGVTVNNVIFKPMIRLASETDATFEPYSNICPISGRTEMKVEKCGNNLSSVNVLPSNPAYYWGSTFSDFTSVLNTFPAGTYTVSIEQKVVTLPGNGKVQHGHPYIRAKDAEGNYVTLLSYSTTTDNSPSVGKVYEESGTFTIPTELVGRISECYFYCDQADTHNGSERGTYSVENIQIELGSTATSYEPYTGETYDITFPTEARTVYGGTLDMLSGVLTVDKGYTNLGSLNYVNDGRDRMFTGDLYGIAVGKPSNEIADIISNVFKAASNNHTYIHKSDGIISMGPTGNIYIYDSRYTDPADFKTAISDAQLVYPLANPQTYQLDPHALKAIRGTNNIWSDAGDATVRFWTH